MTLHVRFTTVPLRPGTDQCCGTYSTRCPNKHGNSVMTFISSLIHAEIFHEHNYCIICSSAVCTFLFPKVWSLCYKLWFSNPYIFQPNVVIIRYFKLLILLDQIIKGLFEFVAKTPTNLIFKKWGKWMVNHRNAMLIRGITWTIGIWSIISFIFRPG